MSDALLEKTNVQIKNNNNNTVCSILIDFYDIFILLVTNKASFMS